MRTVELKCLRCAQFFDKKSNLKRHLERKYPCKPIELDIKTDILKEVLDEPDDRVLRGILHATDMEVYCKYMENLLKKESNKRVSNPVSFLENEQQKSINLVSNEPKNSNIPVSFLENEPVNQQVIGKSKRLECRYCNKKFTTTNNRYRHEKHSCKAIYTDELPDDIDMPQTTMEELDRKEIIEAVLSDKSILKEINDIANKQTNIINNTTNNTTNNNNNTTNNTNSHNTTNNNGDINIHITQNIYGEEKFDYIKNNRKIEAHLEKLADSDKLSDNRKFFLELFRLAYFSKKHPENKTFKIDNAKATVIKILEDLPDKWKYVLIDDVVKDKILQIFSFITDHTNIVSEGTNVEQTIEDVREERQPAITEIKKEFVNMEILNFKNNKLEEKREAAKLLNRKS
jgi:hypothetical protein